MQTQLDLSAEASCRTVQVANYNHDMKEIMQEILYENTNQGMQKDPQLYNILVQSVCIPSLKGNIVQPKILDINPSKITHF